MKGAEMLISAPLPQARRPQESEVRLRDFDTRSGLQPVLAGCYDHLAGLKTAADDGDVILKTAERHGTNCNLRARVDHVGVLSVRAPLNRGRRNRDDIPVHG